MFFLSSDIKIIADSLNVANNKRLTTFQVKFPICLLAELNTHRVLSKNAGSSRAKPSKKLREDLKTWSYFPIEWQNNKPGMQGDKSLSGFRLLLAKFAWELHKQTSLFCNFLASDVANLHKQYANRLMATHSYTDVLISSTEWSNFFMLRAHHDAQLEFKAIATCMLKLYESWEPIKVQEGDWHLPYISEGEKLEVPLNILKKISIARCARVSYSAFDGSDSIEQDLKLCNKLFGSNPMHLSPTEHIAQAQANLGRYGNFQGWKQYRQFINQEHGGTYQS